MTCPITCPKCSAEFVLPAGLRGRLVRCPTCLSVYKPPERVPPPGDSSSDDSPAVNGPGWLTFVATTLFLFGISVLALIFVKYHRDRSAEDAKRVREMQLQLELAQKPGDRGPNRNGPAPAAEPKPAAAPDAPPRGADADVRPKAVVIAVAEARAKLDADAKQNQIELPLRKGTLAKATAEVQSSLRENPADEQTRFGLGVLQFFRAVEKLGQSLYAYGLKPENSNIPFLRLPVPKNPRPNGVTYEQLRAVFAEFAADLATAEATLADITTDTVQLPLRLNLVQFDFAGDGRPTCSFLDVLKKLLGGDGVDVIRDNPDFFVRFDRGDVAWLRAYCHLLTAVMDLTLAADLEFYFDRHAGDLFEKAKVSAAPPPGGIVIVIRGTDIRDPVRLKSARRHLLTVCKLNRETWKYIRAEQDDDHEWLPNANQRGVLGLRTLDNAVDAWFSTMTELEQLLNGEKLLDLGGHFGNPPVVLQPVARACGVVLAIGCACRPKNILNSPLVFYDELEKYLEAEARLKLNPGDRFGLNLREFMENPPPRLEPLNLFHGSIDPKYEGVLRPDNTFGFPKVLQFRRHFEGLGLRGYLWMN